MLKRLFSTKKNSTKKASKRNHYVCVCRELPYGTVYEYRILSKEELNFLDRHNISYTYCDKNRHYFEMGLN